MATKVGKPNLWILKSQTDIMEVYALFITNGFVSLISNETSLKPIKIVCDMGAPQTLMLEDI
jgi:hypothetical protein